ncbi:MAG: hypothetical protein SNJ82_07115, partial [Gemmataceae bacterium]
MDASKRSRYGWIALGAFLCLGTIGGLLKMRAPSRAYAQHPEPPKITVEMPPEPTPPLPSPAASPASLPTPTPLQEVSP